jgi:hypothetical protein
MYASSTKKVDRLNIRHKCTFFAYYYYYYYMVHKVREIGREPRGPHPKEYGLCDPTLHHPLETHYD